MNYYLAAIIILSTLAILLTFTFKKKVNLQKTLLVLTIFAIGVLTVLYIPIEFKEHHFPNLLAIFIILAVVRIFTKKELTK